MTMVLGVVSAGAFAFGLFLVIGQWQARRHPLLEQRVVPYLRDLPEVAAQAQGTAASGLVGSLLLPTARRLARVIGEMVGSSSQVARRLIRLGVVPDLGAFRAKQLQWGTVSFVAAFALSLALTAAGGVSVPALLVFCVVAFVSGFVACDQKLSVDVTRRERQIRAEFGVIADLLALAVAAGETPMAALDRVVKVSSGPMSEELSTVVGDVRAGSTLVAALDALSIRTGVPALARFSEAMATAVERGTPLAEVLRAQAADVREASRRELIESGGRREVAMMVPVVFLILPVTVVFAFYPGFVALHLSAGG